MTLIAAFRCSGKVVLCADRQDTVGDFRVTVNKLAPQDAGKYEVMIGGSGLADLVDGFVDAFAMKVKTWKGNLSEAAARRRTRRFLLDFHLNEVHGYSAEPKDKNLKFIVCLRPKNRQELFLWALRGSAIMSVKEYVLLGWEEQIYEHEVQKFYRPDIPVTQAVIVGLALFSLAKTTSNYVGGDTQVYVADGSAIIPVKNEFIKPLEETISMFNDTLAKVTISLTDPSLSQETFEKQLAAFNKAARGIRTSADQTLVELQQNLNEAS